MTRGGNVVLAAVLALVCLRTSGQVTLKPRDACDFSFCWTDDQVEATGSRLLSEDKTEKPLNYDSDLRCFRSLKLCFWAHTTGMTGRAVVLAQVLNVRRWDSNEIEAELEENLTSDCERDLFILNRAERTVTMIARPGPQSRSKRCIDLYGKPKTVVYKLSTL